MNQYKDNEIMQALLDENNKLIRQRCTVKWLTDHGYYDYIMSRFNDLYSRDDKSRLKESIYRLTNPDTKEFWYCRICGKPAKFSVRNNSYNLWCSDECRFKDLEWKSEFSKSVSRGLQSAYDGGKESILKKRSETIEKNYGVKASSPFSIKEIQNKCLRAVKEKYGVDNVFSLRRSKESRLIKQREESVNLWKNRGLDIEYTDHETIIVKNGCPIHGDIEMDYRTFRNRTKEERINSSTLCPACNPIHSYSGAEVQIAKFLDSFGIFYIANDRKTIAPLELDFYIPDKNLAIEFNGIYFHNEEMKDKFYHQNKSQRCKEHGIQLIQIWEDDWINKKEIILSMLKMKLGLINNKIYARNCLVEHITSEQMREFLELNHVQGSVNAKYKYGLFKKDSHELVAVMTFGSMRRVLGVITKEARKKVELYRYCSKLNQRVIGGASKLLKFAEEELKKNGIDLIITYAKCDWSVGNLYKQLGFNQISCTQPNYKWVNSKGDVKPRYRCRKDQLIKMGYNKMMTETEIMHMRGYHRCWDSGNLKFLKKI